MPLFLPLLTLPILEIAVFIVIGGWIGVGPAILLVALSSVAGAMLLRRVGMAALGRAQAEMARDELPVGTVLEGFCLVIGAILLIIPGFLTSALGLILFVPGVRDLLGRWVLKGLRRRGGMRIWVDGQMVDPATGRPTPFAPGPFTPGPFPPDPVHGPEMNGPMMNGKVIEGEWRGVDDDAQAPPPGSAPGSAPGPEESRWGRPEKDPG